MALPTVTIKDGLGVNQTVPAHLIGAAYQFITSLDGSVPTYRTGITSIAPVATPTTFARIKWATSGVVRVRKVVVSGIATSAGNMEINLTKRSTLGTDGSAVWTATTIAPLDSGNSAAKAVVEYVGTANQDTQGTAVGVVAAGRLQLTADGSGVAVIPFAVDFATGGQQGLVLRAANQNLTIDLMGDAIPSGGKVDFFVEWTEETES